MCVVRADLCPARVRAYCKDVRKGALVFVGCVLALPVFCRWIEDQVSAALSRADAQGYSGYPAIALAFLVLLISARLAGRRREELHGESAAEAVRQSQAAFRTSICRRFPSAANAASIWSSRE